nr:prepilin-type N-terminal cleavage/methylation domain-containing protein [Luteolibacter marinus]
MNFRTSRATGGFSLIELLVVILIISILLTMGAVGLRNIGGKGVSSAVATAEAVFDEARAIAVGKGTKARVMVDVDDIQNTETFKRRIFAAYQELDEDGEPTENWVMASRPTVLPEKTFFSEEFSSRNHKTGSGELDTKSVTFGKTNYDGKYLYYEFNSEGICSTPGASFVIGAGIRPKGEEPRVTGEGKRDFAGFVIWRNGRTSLFRGPDEIGIPSEVTNF